MVSVLAEETFEANGAEIVLAESFDVFGLMDLALRIQLGKLSTGERFHGFNIRVVFFAYRIKLDF